MGRDGYSVDASACARTRSAAAHATRPRADRLKSRLFIAAFLR
jgi:hypothetical protein